MLGPISWLVSEQCFRAFWGAQGAYPEARAGRCGTARNKEGAAHYEQPPPLELLAVTLPDQSCFLILCPFSASLSRVRIHIANRAEIVRLGTIWA